MFNHTGIMPNHMRTQGAQFINAYIGKVQTSLQAKQQTAANKAKLDILYPKATSPMKTYTRSQANKAKLHAALTSK